MSRFTPPQRAQNDLSTFYPPPQQPLTQPTRDVPPRPEVAVTASAFNKGTLTSVMPEERQQDEREAPFGLQQRNRDAIGQTTEDDVPAELREGEGVQR